MVKKYIIRKAPVRTDESPILKLYELTKQLDPDFSKTLDVPKRFYTDSHNQE